MPITRSQDNLLNIVEPTNVSFTVDLESSNITQEKRTRKGTKQAVQNSATNNAQNNSQIRQIVQESMDSFRSDIRDFISNELTSIVHNFNTQANLNEVQPERNRDNTARPLFSSDREPFMAEKVLNIIRNWRIKFTGHDTQMSVDEFIYRVNILTINNLRGDYEILCKHAHSLFEGKALEWYWRYHRRAYDMDWHSLTTALRNQYKEDYIDFDVLDDVRKRKQKHNESFDEYLDLISTLTDRLKTPISDRDLCEILIRNLKAEIRHELLHLEITSVSQLRREVRKHEKFMKDLHTYETRKTNKGCIAKIDNEEKEFDTLTIQNELCAIKQNIKCWNCEKDGHTYFDCMEHRRIFCYGCGAKDIYKPNCTKCAKKTSGNGQKDVQRTY